MVTTTSGTDRQLSPVAQKIKDRRDRIRAAARRPGIRVEPRDEDMRRVLKHQPSGIGFRSIGSVEWPDDSFTRRRLRDGSVKLAEPDQVEQSAEQSPQRRQTSRSQSE